ncbi:N-alpha-acetyltransferase 25, NatB auxiliary subunit [Neocloeon triangulifer]|uniref:N-alpha-acetyltransferase 25, NatB auxiliary subunit n=1 Tax=Neocloeon triangulifer TaxID=2078957 RepID=UPI00286F56E7|nr:N-alpha-acetyltransferase 25, NatB auxiliary subunit [Neocloeon triangulifer]
MAANRSHVDSVVAERRLRPIYDWLDNGNYKKAIQEADKVLKKQPDFLCAKVLRALALLRVGKTDVCDSILESVRSEVPVDEPTLQAMTIAYREMHEFHKICSIYANAVQKEPLSEDLLSHLFMAYVRVGDFKKQQQTAMALYKIRSKNPYYFWGVMSVVMQTREVPENMARSVVLPLAERMVVKMVEQGKVEAEQEVQLYLMILEMQDKIKEALEVLNGPLGEKLVSNLGLIHTKKAALLARINCWKEAHLLYKQLLREDQDRWNYYQEYFKTSVKLWNNTPSERSSEEELVREKSEKLWHIPDVSAKEIAEFLDMLSEANKTRGKKHFRAPFLAKLELYRLMSNKEMKPEELLGDIVELINDYFVPFGLKPCCFSDLRLYLPLVPSEKASGLLQKLFLSHDLGENELPVDIFEMQRHINLIKIERSLGLQENLSSDRKISLVKDLLRRYDHGASLEKDVNPTDFPVHDAYALIACHILQEISFDKNQEDKLVEAAAILEHALSLSPSNFHFKLLLLRIYTLVGGGSASQSIFEIIDIKHMQLDSLGWLHCATLSSTGLLYLASAHCEAALKFFTANHKDSLDHLTYSYKYGSFLKISEFVEFRDRLHHSHHYIRCSIERMLSELLMPANHEQAVEAVFRMDVSPSDDNIDWEKLQDNRDLDVLISFDPKRKQLSQEQVEQTFVREVAVIKLRRNQLRCLAAAFDLLKPPSTESANGNNDDILPKLISELSVFTLPPAPYSGTELNYPIRSRADAIPSTRNLSSFVLALQLAYQLSELRRDAQSDDSKAAKLMTQLAEETSLVCTEAEELLQNDDSLLTRRNALEAATNCYETLSFMALFCGVYKNLTQPSTMPGKKGKKKKEVSDQAQPKILQGLSELAKHLRDCCNKMLDSIGRWETRVALIEEVSDHLCKWSLEDPEGNPEHKQVTDDKNRRRDEMVVAVVAKLRHSYMSSAKELQNLLSHKCKHFALFTS